MRRVVVDLTEDLVNMDSPAISLPSATATRPMYSDPIVIDAVTAVQNANKTNTLVPTFK